MAQASRHNILRSPDRATFKGLSAAAHPGADVIHQFHSLHRALDGLRIAQVSADDMHSWIPFQTGNGTARQYANRFTIAEQPCDQCAPQKSARTGDQRFRGWGCGCCLLEHRSLVGGRSSRGVLGPADDAPALFRGNRWRGSLVERLIELRHRHTNAR